MLPRRPPRSNKPIPSTPKKFQKPGVVFQPKTILAMQKGINQVINAIRPTLGPLPRVVAVEMTLRGKKPELLDSGGTIARRIIQLQNRDEDVGAMFIRHVLWQVQEKVGDGTATTAVMFQTMFNKGVRYILAGGNPMQLRGFLEEGARLILDQLDGMTVHLEGKDKLTRLAETICHDAELAKMMGEIFDIIGAYGRLEICSGRGRSLEREYVVGMYWDGGLVSRELINDPKLLRSSLEDALILISDLEIEEPQELLPLLDLALHSQVKSLVLISSKLSERALGVLLAKPNREKVQVMAVKAPGLENTFRQAALQDIAILTGGIPLLKAAGDRLEGARLEHLGRARRIWVDMNTLNIVGGRGNARQLRQHIASLRSAFAQVSDSAPPRDEKLRKDLQERIGKLLGGSATLWIGDVSPIRIEARKALAERTAEAMRAAMRSGVAPGGGVALLACRPILLAKLRQTQDVDEAAAYGILLKALESPIRALIENAGSHGAASMADIELAGPGFGFDVERRQITNMAEAGIFDSASVIKTAVFSAVYGAAVALTTDVIIHRKNPPESVAKP